VLDSPAFTSAGLSNPKPRLAERLQAHFVTRNGVTFHCGGVNVADRPRGAAFLRPRIDLPSALGETFATDDELRKLLGCNGRNS
jgi:hypothetical protein